MKLILVLAAALLLSPYTAHADEASVHVSNAYAYATTPAQKNGAVFMAVHNDGEAADKITAASAAVAQAVELHTHIMDGDKMMMREVEAYDLPAGEVTTLHPHGHHIMLMGLNAPLKAGDTFPLTLTLEGGAPLTVDVLIKNPGDAE